MEALALLPGIIAVVVALRTSPARAFLDVYLPVLLLCPDYFRWVAIGLPDPTMSEAAILPIAGLYFLRPGPRWRFSTCDALVFGFAFMTALTEFHAKNYAEAQNLMFDALGTIVLPYILAKGIVEPNGLRVEFARRIAFLLTIVTGMFLFEAKMGRPVVRVVLDRFFPWQGTWVTTFRYGLPRAAGPYGHAILAGMVLMTGYRLQRWLEWTRGWSGRLRWVNIERGRFYSAVLLIGFLLTLVRGPWLGGLAAGGVVLIARAKSRRAIALASALTILVTAPPAFMAFQSYVSVGREGATSLSQETAAYRKELIEEYTAVALQHALWGWGRAGWPTIPGLESTDNHYLLLALNHGFVTLGLFLGVMLWNGVRLVRFGASRSRSDPTALLAFTLASIYLGFFVSLGTVYLGMQTVQMFFILAGWSDGLLLQRTPPVTARAAAPAMETAPLFSFRRVIA